MAERKRADLLAIADGGITIAGHVKHCTVDHDVLQHSLHRAACEKMHEYSVSTDAPRLTRGVRVVPLIHGGGGYMGEAAVQLLREISAAVASREETRRCRAGHAVLG
eukprot:2187634-Amphidinium_carterae.1